MPYDPALPTDNSPLASAEIRGQLTGFKEIIDAKVASVTGGMVDNTDPANPVIRTDVVVGTPQLVFGYSAGDVVSSNGALFVCLGDSQGQLPNDSVTPNGPWQVLAGMKGYVESTSSNNTNAVATLDTPYADPGAEALRTKQNELILTLRR